MTNELTPFPEGQNKVRRLKSIESEKGDIILTEELYVKGGMYISDIGMLLPGAKEMTGKELPLLMEEVFIELKKNLITRIK